MSLEKSPTALRAYHGLPEDYRLDGLIVYGTWPHPNKVEPNHLVPLRTALARADVPATSYTLRSLADEDAYGQRSNYIDHAYELCMPDYSGRLMTVWFVPVEGTRLAGEYVYIARRALEVKKIIVLGMCAGLLEDMCPGEFVMPTEIMPNDTGRAFKDYKITSPSSPYAYPDRALYESLRQRILQYTPQAKIWETRGYTDEALPMQTKSLARRLVKEGYGSIDMESALIVGAAANAHLGPPVPAAAILYDIDNPLVGTIPRDAGMLLSVNQAREAQYSAALDELCDVPLMH